MSSEQIRLIRECVHRVLGADARVYLFGSRVDDAARGGDLDLYIEVDRPVRNRASMASRLAGQLQLALGDQRIDIVLVDPSTPRLPIHETARSTGVVL